MTKFCLSLHYNGDNFLLVNRKEIYKFKVHNENTNFPTQFFEESISNKFNSFEFREVSLKVNVYDFSVSYNSVDESSILNIHKYLNVKSNIK